MVYSVDSITTDMAVLVDDEGNRHPVAPNLLPAGTQYGDMVRFDGGEYRLAPRLTEERRARVLSLQEKLRRRPK